MAFAKLFLSQPGLDPPATKMRDRGPGAVPREADNSSHKAGRGELGASPRKRHTLPRQSWLDAAGRVQRNARPESDDHSLGPTGVRPGPIAGTAGEGQRVDVSADPRKPGARGVGKLERARGPSAHVASTRIHHVLAQAPPLRGWPASDLPLVSCPTRRDGLPATPPLLLPTTPAALVSM